VLPDKVRVEFTKPKRARILSRLIPSDGNILWLAGAIVFGAIVLAVAVWLSGRHESQQLASEASASAGMPVKQPAATPESTSAATPAHIAVPTLRPTLDRMPAPGPELAVAQYAPRATLVKLPPARAVLVRLPQWRIGDERPVMMPYGLEVAARLKGKLPSTDMLPMFGNALGDTWFIGDSAWVWVAAPGAGSANWIDP
jgi:hypothetical protein